MLYPLCLPHDSSFCVGLIGARLFSIRLKSGSYYKIYLKIILWADLILFHGKVCLHPTCQALGLSSSDNFLC